MTYTRESILADARSCLQAEIRARSNGITRAKRRLAEVEAFFGYLALMGLESAR